MNYYYSLLESYQQLKRRTFKLSLREQEEDAAKEQARQDADAAFATPREISPEERKTMASGDELIFVKSGPNLDKVSAIGGPFKSQSMKGVKSLDDLNDKSLADVISYFMKGEKGPEKEKNKDVDPSLQSVTKLEAAQESLEPEDLPGYEENTRKDRGKTATDLAKAKLAGETEGGEGISSRSSAFGDTTLQEKVVSSPELSPEQVTNSVEAASLLINGIKKVKAGQTLTKEELQDVSSKMEVTKNGILFEGVYLQYMSNATKKNDPYKNMALQLNQQILNHNKTLSKMDKNSDAYKDNYVKPLVESRGRELANRGVLLEQIDVISKLATAYQSCKDSGGDCTKLEKSIGEYFDKAKKDKSLDEMTEMLKKGLCAQAGQCLVGINSADDPVVTQSVLTYLTGVDGEGNSVPDYEGPGMSEDKAKLLVERAQDNGVEALALLVLSTRGFNKAYEGLDVTDAIQWGGEGSDLKGQKDDVRMTVTRSSFNDWIKNIEDNQTEVEKNLSEKAKCAGDGVGANSLAQGSSKTNEDSNDGDDLVTVGIEEKVLDSLSGSRLKAGEGTNSKFNKQCDGKLESDELEKKFLEANNERLANCQGEMKFGKKNASAFDAACSFQKKVSEAPMLKSFDSLMKGGKISNDEDETVQYTGDQLVTTWASSSKVSEPKRTQRANLAKSAFSKLSNPTGDNPLTKDEKEALSKVKDDLEKAQINKQLDDNTDDNNVLSGEGLGYVLFRHTQDSGSLNECLKDARGYADGQQKMAMINTTVYGAYGMVTGKEARVKREKGSGTYSLETNSGEQIMGGTFERGQLVVSMNEGIMSDVKKPKKTSKEELFISFLKGQKELLEKLMK